MFGLFAPVSKVSKSPLKYKPGNCVVHSGSGLPPPGMKRTGSKESMLSMTSSITSATSTARRVRLGVTSLTPQVGRFLLKYRKNVTIAKYEVFGLFLFFRLF